MKNRHILYLKNAHTYCKPRKYKNFVNFKWFEEILRMAQKLCHSQYLFYLFKLYIGFTFIQSILKGSVFKYFNKLSQKCDQ